MHQETIEYLKRAIKRTYKRYIGERTDEKATLLDVAKFFNISIDESRLEDYVLKKIDYSDPSIEIIDKNNNISYIATYTGNADLLSFSGAMQFNSVVSTSPVVKEESLYYIGSRTPIITKMTFTDGEYELVFEREMPNSVGTFCNDGIKMTVRYLQNVVYDGKKVKQPLFNRIYKNNCRYEEFDGVFEQVYTYGPHRFIKWDVSQDKYAYIKNNKVIYGINEFEQKGVCNSLQGICFESTNVSTKDYFPQDFFPQNYFPRKMYAEDYPLLSENNINSAMIFRGVTEDRIHHSLQIYKSKDATSISYHSKKRFYEGRSHHVETIANEEYDLSNLYRGNISSKEIQNVLTSLQERLGDNVFIDIISNELNAFGAKLDIKRELVQEELDPLSPKLLINKSFEEIYTLVSANKNDYFKLISEQFETAINTNRTLEKSHTKILKPSNSKK